MTREAGGKLVAEEADYRKGLEQLRERYARICREAADAPIYNMLPSLELAKQTAESIKTVVRAMEQRGWGAKEIYKRR